MTERIRYSSGRKVKGDTGALVLQQAYIRSADMDLILAGVCIGETEEKRQFSLRMGEWFQNTFVREMSAHLHASAVDVFEKCIGRLEESEAFNCSIFIGAGELGYVRSRGEGTSVSLLQEVLGKTTLVKMLDGTDDEIIVQRGAGILILVDIILSEREIQCLKTAENDEKIEKALEEVFEDKEKACAVFIKAD